MGIETALAAPLTLTLAGTDYTFAPLTLKDLSTIVATVRSKRISAALAAVGTSQYMAGIDVVGSTLAKSALEPLTEIQALNDIDGKMQAIACSLTRAGRKTTYNDLANDGAGFDMEIASEIVLRVSGLLKGADEPTSSPFVPGPSKSGTG